MAYANNETYLKEGEGYIQGSLVDSWEQHFSASLIDGTEVHPHGDDHINPRQGVYFKGSLNPIVHAPNPHFELMLDDGTHIKGSVPHNSKFFQSAEGGVGYKKDGWRAEGVLKWNRFHIGKHSVEFAALPNMMMDDDMMMDHHMHDHMHDDMMDDGMMMMPEDMMMPMTPEDIVMMYGAGMMNHHIDNWGFLGKVFRDFSLAGIDSDGARFYVGTGYGLLRSNGPMTSDWSRIFVAEAGVLMEFTESADIQVGYEFTHYGETEHGPVMVDGYERHSAVVGFHIYRGH